MMRWTRFESRRPHETNRADQGSVFWGVQSSGCLVEKLELDLGASSNPFQDKVGRELMAPTAAGSRLDTTLIQPYGCISAEQRRRTSTGVFADPRGSHTPRHRPPRDQRRGMGVLELASHYPMSFRGRTRSTSTGFLERAPA